MWGRLPKPVLMSSLATVVATITKSVIAATKNWSATRGKKGHLAKSASWYDIHWPHSHLAEGVAGTESEGTPSGWILRGGRWTSGAYSCCWRTTEPTPHCQRRAELSTSYHGGGHWGYCFADVWTETVTVVSPSVAQKPAVCLTTYTRSEQD